MTDKYGKIIGGVAEGIAPIASAAGLENTGKYAGLGASVGSAFGPLGTAVGAGLGALGGGVMDIIGAQKAKEAKWDNYTQGIQQEALQAQYQSKPAFKYGGGDLTEYKGDPNKVDGIELADKFVSNGEVKIGNYIFSNHLTPEGSKKTFAQLARNVDKKYQGRDNPFTKVAKEREISQLVEKHEMARESVEDSDSDGYKFGGYEKEKYANGGTYPREDMRPRDLTTGELLPDRIVGNIQGLGFDGNVAQTNNPSLANLAPETMTIDPNYEANLNKEVLPDSAFSSNTSGWAKFGEQAAVVAPSLLGAAGSAFLASKVNYDRVSPAFADYRLNDSTQALNQVGTAFSSQNNALGTLSNSGGYMTNRLASAALEAQKRGEVARAYSEANTGTINQANQVNAGIQNDTNRVNANIQMEEQANRLSGYGNALTGLTKGVESAAYVAQEQRRTEQMMPFLGSANFRAMLDKGYDPKGMLDAVLYGNRYTDTIAQRAK